MPTGLVWCPVGRWPMTLSWYLEKPASAASDAIERHRWLVAGLEAADNHRDAERIRSALQSTEAAMARDFGPWLSKSNSIGRPQS